MSRILYFSIIIWILVDRIKPIWHDKQYGSYITNGVALAVGLLISIYYHLDMLYALELTEEITLIGEVMTGFALMGGSSCIHEIIDGLKQEKMDTEYVFLTEEETKDFESEDM